MEPYATAAEPGPLNGNRPAVGGISSFISENRMWFIGGIAVIIGIVIAMVMMRKKKKKRSRGRRGRRGRRFMKRRRRR
jgi:uncharacterized phage infection (PIP) family protein YhgE